MKKTIMSIIAAITCMLSIVGCKSVPSTNTVYSASYAIGVSSALVMNQTKITNEQRIVIIDIINEINTAVPVTNTTFSTTWTKIAERHVNKLVENGKITEDESKLIITVFSTAVNTLDYLVYKRYPTVGQYVELVEATTHGFCSGILTFFKPTNTVSSTTSIVYDKEAYDCMIESLKIK